VLFFVDELLYMVLLYSSVVLREKTKVIESCVATPDGGALFFAHSVVHRGTGNDSDVTLYALFCHRDFIENINKRNATKES